MPDMTKPLDLGQNVEVDKGDLGSLHALAHAAPEYPESPLWARISELVGWGYNRAGKMIEGRAE